MTKKIILIAVIVVVALGLAGYKFAKPDFAKIFAKSQTAKILTPDQAKTKALDYIDNNLVQKGTKVNVKDIAEANGLYKLDLDVSGQPIVAYMTEDGSQFFPSAMDMNAAPAKPAADQQQAAQQPIPKSDTPNIQLFVMSYCPYGTQMEKGILPVLAALGNKVNFNLEFVDYSMHNDPSTGDQKELNENLRQYCIQKLQPDKLDSYLNCFLQKGQGTEDACMAQAGVDAAPVATCMTATDNQYSVSKNFKNQSTYNGQFPTFKVDEADNQKYNVQGSPTLVINGVVDQAGNRDSASLLKDICSAFNTAPAACSTQLSSTAPSPGFGTGTDTSGSSASCATN
jgi:hypothetical protein